MVAVKTLRDDFALVFLQPQLSVDAARQMQGFPPGDAAAMLRSSYAMADAAMEWRQKMLSAEAEEKMSLLTSSVGFK